MPDRHFMAMKIFPALLQRNPEKGAHEKGKQEINLSTLSLTMRHDPSYLQRRRNGARERSSLTRAEEVMSETVHESVRFAVARTSRRSLDRTLRREFRQDCPGGKTDTDVAVIANPRIGGGSAGVAIGWRGSLHEPLRGDKEKRAASARHAARVARASRKEVKSATGRSRDAQLRERGARVWARLGDAKNAQTRASEYQWVSSAGKHFYSRGNDRRGRGRVRGGNRAARYSESLRVA